MHPYPFAFRNRPIWAAVPALDPDDLLIIPNLLAHGTQEIQVASSPGRKRARELLTDKST